MKVIVYLMLFLLVGCINSAERTEKEGLDTDPVVEEQGKPVAKEGQKLICKIEKETGSHFVKKVCRTKSQIIQAREEAKKMLDDVLRTGSPSRGTEN